MVMKMGLATKKATTRDIWSPCYYYYSFHLTYSGSVHAFPTKSYIATTTRRGVAVAVYTE
jgi:hypothetical protein